MPAIGKLLREVAMSTLLAVTGCGPASILLQDDEAAPVRSWHYDVTVPAGGRTMDVRLCFEGRPPPRIVAGSADGYRHLRYAVVDGLGTPLERSRRHRAIDTAGVEPGGCLRYGVDVHSLAGQNRWSSPSGRTSYLLRTNQWLWRPDQDLTGVDVTARFNTGFDVRVSVPWPVDDGAPARFVLAPTAFYWLGYTAVGNFELHEWELAGSTFEVVLLDADMAAGTAGLRGYLDDAASAVAMLYGGEFPIDHVQVIIVPVEGSALPVRFGRVGRGGGASVYLLVDRDAPAHRLPGGWTTVHELLHLGMPYVHDPWMGEGWASYYTEILRTRMGHRSEADGWNELEAAFERGRTGGRGMTMQRTSDWMSRFFAFQRVYWSGAALAFLIDVELRTDSGGEIGLDDAMRELHRCCRLRHRRIPARELLAHLDRWYGKRIFTTIADRYLAATAFPDVRQAYSELGIEVVDGKLTLDESHPNAPLRRAIMAPRSLAP